MRLLFGDAINDEFVAFFVAIPEHCRKLFQLLVDCPYGAYIVMASLALNLLLFLLWRCAARRARVRLAEATKAEAKLAILIQYVDDTGLGGGKSSQVIYPQVLNYTKESLDLVRSIFDRCMSVINTTQADTLEKLSAAHEQTMDGVKGIVASFTENQRDE